MPETLIEPPSETKPVILPPRAQLLTPQQVKERGADALTPHERALIHQSRPYKLYTMPQELEEYNDLLNRVFVPKGRKRIRGEELFRVSGVFPQFVPGQATGEDLVNIYHPETGAIIAEGYNYRLKVHVESYTVKETGTGKTRIKEEVPSTSFQMDADKFVEKYESAS